MRLGMRPVRAMCCAAFAILLSAAAPPPMGPVIAAVRIDVAESPQIDGDLSDSAWAKARVIDGFHQIDLQQGEPGTERTVVRVLYDADTLYFGIYAYDRVPGQIVPGTRARDGNANTGDYVRVLLDPGPTRRDGYGFEVLASGARTDYLIQNNSTALTQWNAIWDARVQIVPDGWIAEIAIPFRSLSYDRASTEWGINFARVIRRKNEANRWSAYAPTIAPIDLSRIGTLTGISDLDEGIGLDAQIYGSFNYKEDWAGANHGADSFKAGATVYYKVAPALTGTLTVNPDFADAPLDARQVNLSRFSLFTPETRNFFLQDAGAFEFGGRAMDTANARPFFSRNMGLVDDEPVALLAGGKLSGQYDDLGIGALSVLANHSADAPRQVLSTARITKPVMAESKLGVIVTHGDPTGLSNNTVAGFDFQYRDSQFAGGETPLFADAYYERSFSSTEGDDSAYGAAVVYSSEPWGGWLRHKGVGADFAPALGFINRPGIRVYDAGLTHITRFQGDGLRNMQFGTRGLLTTGLNDRLSSSFVSVWANMNSNVADFAQVEIVDFHERILEPFTLPGDLVVPEGRYGWTNVFSRVNTSVARSYVVNLSTECCSFFDGSYFRSDFSVTMRAFEMLELTPHYVATFINLPAGYVGIHVPSLDAAVNVSPDMQFVMQVQFDNISRDVGFSARYRWEYAPGDELYATLAQSAEIPGSHLLAETTQLSVRLGHTLRF